MRRVPLLLLLAALAAGCSGGSSRPEAPTIGAAKTFRLAGFQPSGPVEPGRLTTLAFTIEQPSGKPLTSYVRGPGPHTGVHLIVVRDDLSMLIHRHPPIGAGGHVSESIDFPEPGRWRVLVDAYPKLSGLRSFQLHQDVSVGSTDRESPVPPFARTVVVDGYRVELAKKPKLRALQAAFLQVTVTDPQGRPVRFRTWYGALAHAIFFRKGSLDYFHTHVCGPNTPGCTSVLGNPSLASRTTKPGRLDVGVLLPASGTWRLFLQFKSGDRVITAPFTLRLR